LAEEFAAEQYSLEKSKKVYLNTLAVYAVHSYLTWLNIKTTLTGDSWHKSLRATFDAADLEVVNVGKLECLPVLPGKKTISLPPEATIDRIGYVVVQFHQKFDAVKLLGFISINAIFEPSEIIKLNDLRPLEALLETIHIVNLRQWLEGIFKQDWQVPELLISHNLRGTAITDPLTLESKSQSQSVSRAKVVNIGKQVVLMVQLTSNVGDVFDIRVRTYPGEDETYLPADLQLLILDEDHNPCMEVHSSNIDNWIQLEFSCEHEKKFSVILMLGDTTIKEDFVV
ncbi:MAG: DUF1822 family protein, partial [Cyanobacteria bacterium J06639_18]